VPQPTAPTTRWYLAGLSASLLGNSAMSVVAGIWVKGLTHSSAEAGIVSACLYAPTMAAPLAGLAADRLALRGYLIALNVAAVPVVLVLAAVRRAADVWIVFAVCGLLGGQLTLVDPAEDALFARLFAADVRRRLNGWRLGLQEVGRVTAPLFGAGLFVLAGGPSVAGLDAATFLIAAACTARLDPLPRPPAARRPATAIRELVAGAGHLAVSRSIRTVVAAASAAMAVSALSVAARYSLVQGLGERPAFLGVLDGVLGVGSIVASLSAARIVAWRGEHRLALIGLINFALGDVLLAAGALPAAVAGFLVLGFALPYIFLAALSIVQRHTPGELQGRASAALTLALFGPQAPGQAAGAWLIAHVAYPPIYLGSAALSGLVALGLARAG
jgi:hypothetical protein